MIDKPSGEALVMSRSNQTRSSRRVNLSCSYLQSPSHPVSHYQHPFSSITDEGSLLPPLSSIPKSASHLPIRMSQSHVFPIAKTPPCPPPWPMVLPRIRFPCLFPQTTTRTSSGLGFISAVRATTEASASYVDYAPRNEWRTRSENSKFSVYE